MYKKNVLKKKNMLIYYLIGEEGKRYQVLIKDFNTFMYDHTLNPGKNIFAVIVYKFLVQKEY